MKKLILLLTVISVCILPMTALSVNGEQRVSVIIDGNNYNGEVKVKNQTTYVEISEFASAFDNKTETYYDHPTKTLYLKSKSLYFMCQIGQNYIIANQRYLYHEQPICLENGRVYAPIMQLYKAFGAAIRWSDQIGGFYLTSGNSPILSGEDYYKSDQVYWLSRIINAEAKGEILMGKIAVGNVVLNRVRSKDFPSTIYGVIFDKKYGVQFTPVANGSINEVPGAESIIAAKICLEYYSISNEILYFVNPDISPNSWAAANRVLYKKIGNHAFYY